MSGDKLNRFMEAQEDSYEVALAEIQRGKKQSHWMWFVFPQIKGLGNSAMAQRFAIGDMDEATAYLHHPLLAARLIEISRALLHHKNKTALQIFGTPDDLKLRSSMTLFSRVHNADPVFQEVLDAFFNGEPDKLTLGLIHP